MKSDGWRAVLFDLDGTLADTVELILLSFRHTMRTHLGEAPPDARFLETIGIPLPVQLGRFARSESEREEMLQTYITFQRDVHDEMVRPYPGALSVVSTLRERSILVGVVTSKARGIATRTLSICGFNDHFDFIVCGDEVTRGKPHPEPVETAMRALRVDDDPDRVVFVGDSTHDLRAGRMAGTRTAAVAWGPISRALLEQERPDYFLHRMEDVLDITPGPSRWSG